MTFLQKIASLWKCTVVDIKTYKRDHSRAILNVGPRKSPKKNFTKPNIPRPSLVVAQKIPRLTTQSSKLAGCGEPRFSARI